MRYAGKDSQLRVYGDIELGLRGAIAARLAETLSSQKESKSNCFVVMDNFLLLFQNYCAIIEKN